MRGAYAVENIEAGPFNGRSARVAEEVKAQALA
jgi:hypothetical protein